MKNGDKKEKGSARLETLEKVMRIINGAYHDRDETTHLTNLPLSMTERSITSLS